MECELLTRCQKSSNLEVASKVHKSLLITGYTGQFKRRRLCIGVGPYMGTECLAMEEGGQ